MKTQLITVPAVAEVKNPDGTIKTPATPEQRFIERNGVRMMVERAETKQVTDKKTGEKSEVQHYWNFSLPSDTYVSEVKEKQADGSEKVTTTLDGEVETFFGGDVLLDYFTAKLQGNVQLAQKNVDGTMDDKLKALCEWCEEFGGGLRGAQAAIAKKEKTMQTVLGLGADMNRITQLMFKPGNTPQQLAEYKAQLDKVQAEMVALMTK